MKRCTIVTIVTLMFALALGGTALAGEGPGTKAVRQANENITKLLKKKAKPGSKAEQALAAKVALSVRDFLDVEALGRRALRDHWAKLEQAKQQEFMKLLRRLIEQNYIKGLRANLEYKVVYLDESAKGDSVVVSTEIKTRRRGRPYTVSIEYVLRHDGAKLRAYDVITDSVGLVENYRAQFNKIIAKRGFDGLLARMRKKADKLDK
jgi:phospholipid transport system substrate-binding protein